MNQSNHRTYINHDWHYINDYQDRYISAFPKTNEKVSLPHTNIELPLNYFDEKSHQFVSAYERKLKVEKQTDKRYILHFEGVMAYAEVYLNQTLVGSHKGGYTPFSFDVTKYLTKEENTIFVKVDSTERTDIPPHGFVVDYLTYGGIYREVYLEEVDENFIKHGLIDARDGQLDVRLLFNAEKPSKEEVIIIIEQDGREIKEIDCTLDYHQNEQTLSYNIDLQTWTLDKPILYTLRILKKNETIYQTNFASRTLTWKEDGFYLNNKRIQLKGLNRHQSYPYVGYAMPSSMQKLDADILKYELGCNIVRSSHYPPSKHFLDRCDEIGLLVFNELPGWQHIGDEDWQDLSVLHVKEMILRDYNHPSIIIWGTRINESKDMDSFYQRTHDMAKQYDHYRATGGVRNFKQSSLIEDVYTYNDFVHRGNNIGLEPPKKVRKQQSPYLVTEYNGHMYPTKSFDDEAHRVSQLKRHLAVQHDAHKHQDIAGAIGWCMADYNTHKYFGSGDKICYHGVMDIFRVPKYASAAYRSQSEEPYMKVASNIQIGDFEASEIKDVYVLTNAEYIKFYINDDFIGDFYPSEQYIHLPHPPVIINDFIGHLIHDHESFSTKDADRVKSVLLHIMHHGMKLPLKEKLKMLIVLMKYKMSIDEAAKLYEKYVGKWGMESLEYRFEAIKNEQVILKETIGPLKETSLLVEVNNHIISETATYEVARIIVKHVDQYQHILPYSSEVIDVEVEGPIQLIGPNLLTLRGGSIGLYVKSIHQKGTGTIKIHSQRYGTKEVQLEVK
ncbi:MAG: glycoside hydrolase family 2 TIM barrel-domain containing protein [Candidatus Izemoplasmataceae bacterium]